MLSTKVVRAKAARPKGAGSAMVTSVAAGGEGAVRVVAS
jgi:hypothetical protein